MAFEKLYDWYINGWNKSRFFQENYSKGAVDVKLAEILVTIQTYKLKQSQENVLFWIAQVETTV